MNLQSCKNIITRPREEKRGFERERKRWRRRRRRKYEQQVWLEIRIQIENYNGYKIMISPQVQVGFRIHMWLLLLVFSLLSTLHHYYFSLPSRPLRSSSPTKSRKNYQLISLGFSLFYLFFIFLFFFLIFARDSSLSKRIELG